MTAADRPYTDLSAFFEGANTVTIRRVADLARFNTEIAEWMDQS